MKKRKREKEKNSHLIIHRPTSQSHSPVIQSVFLAIIDHSVLAERWSAGNCCTGVLDGVLGGVLDGALYDGLDGLLVY